MSTLWSTGDIGKRLGVTAERARQLSHREGFPRPAVEHGQTRLWTPTDIERWIAANRPDKATEP